MPISMPAWRRASLRSSMSQLARDTGLSREGLYKALSREGNPSFDTIMKAARGLGYRLKLERMR